MGHQWILWSFKLQRLSTLRWGFIDGGKWEGSVRPQSTGRCGRGVWSLKSTGNLWKTQLTKTQGWLSIRNAIWKVYERRRGWGTTNIFWSVTLLPYPSFRSLFQGLPRGSHMRSHFSHTQDDTFRHFDRGSSHMDSESQFRKKKQTSKQTNYTDLGAQPLLGEGHHPPSHKEEEEEDSRKNDCMECYTFLS